MHPPNKAICKYIVCFERTFCSGSIWLTRIIKNLNKNHCLLPLDSIQVVADSLEGWQRARYTVLGDIQTSMEGPVCHLPPPLMLGSQSNRLISLEKYLYKARRWDSAAGLNFQNCRKPHTEEASFQKHLEWPPVSLRYRDASQYCIFPQGLSTLPLCLPFPHNERSWSLSS